MGKYDLNIKALGLLLTPTFLRRPFTGALLYAVLAPVNELNAKFRNMRKLCDYRLYHNGQVCYLRGMMNDYFDPFYRRITITDERESTENGLLYDREINENKPVPMRYRPAENDDTQEDIPEYSMPEGRLIARRGFGGASAYDFWVNIPYDLYQKIDKERFEAIVRQYKLATKRFGINYK